MSDTPEGCVYPNRVPPMPCAVCSAAGCSVRPVPMTEPTTPEYGIEEARQIVEKIRAGLAGYALAHADFPFDHFAELLDRLTTENTKPEESQAEIARLREALGVAIRYATSCIGGSDCDTYFEEDSESRTATCEACRKRIRDYCFTEADNLRQQSEGE